MILYLKMAIYVAIGGVQWPAGDGATSGGSVMVLGETIGIVPGRKDADCAVLKQPAAASTDAAGGVAPPSATGGPAPTPAEDGGFCYVCLLAGIVVLLAVGVGCKSKLVVKGGSGESIYAADPVAADASAGSSS